MISTQSKSLIIVYNSTTKQCAEFLLALIGEQVVNGIPIKAIAFDDKEFAKHPPQNKTASQKILYIGDFAESRIASKNIIKWQFDNFGFRYGWLGNKAVISFNDKKITEDEFYKMADYAKNEFKKYDLDMAAKVGEANFWDELPLAGKIGLGVGVGLGGIATLLLAGLFGGSDNDSYSYEPSDDFRGDPFID